MQNKKPSTKQEMKSWFAYVVGLSLVFWAVVWDIRVMDQLDVMKEKSRAGLQLTSVAAVEEIESFILRSQASYEEYQAQSLEAKSQMYYQMSITDAAYAERSRSRSDYYAKKAAQDQENANVMLSNVTTDEHLRAEILHNVTVDQQEEEKLVNELRQVHSGLCAHKAFQRICDMIGGTVDLQRKADDEYVKIQQEISKKDDFSKREFLEKLVAATLQGEATEFNKTSADLLKTAQYWSNCSKQDSSLALRYNKTAEELEEVADRLEGLGEKALGYESSNLGLAERNFEDAEAAYKVASHQALLASLDAILALCFFALKLLIDFVGILKSMFAWAGNTRTSENEFWRCSSYCALHVLIFFSAIGVCGDFVSVIGHYDWRQRTAIITWFSFLGSMIQTFSLHLVPHVLAEWPLNRGDVYNISKHAFLRLVVLMALFGIEFLIMLVVAGETFLPPFVRFFGNPFSLLCGVLLLVLHVHSFEPRHISLDDNHSLSTFVTEDDYSQAAASEETPLTTREDLAKTSNGSTTVALLGMDLGWNGRGGVSSSDLQSQYSLESTSPYIVRFRVDLFYLTFATEILFSCCMIGVLTDCLPLAYQSFPGKVVLTSLLVFLAILTCVLAAVGCASPRTLKHHTTDIEIVSV